MGGEGDAAAKMEKTLMINDFFEMMVMISVTGKLCTFKRSKVTYSFKISTQEKKYVNLYKPASKTNPNVLPKARQNMN